MFTTVVHLASNRLNQLDKVMQQAQKEIRLDALFSLHAVTGLQIPGRDVKQLNRGDSNSDSVPFIFFNDSVDTTWVFCYPMCTILKINLNLNLNSIGVHMGHRSAVSFLIIFMLWVVFIPTSSWKCGSITEIRSLFQLMRRYADAENLFQWPVDLNLCFLVFCRWRQQWHAYHLRVRGYNLWPRSRQP